MSARHYVLTLEFGHSALRGVVGAKNAGDKAGVLFCSTQSYLAQGNEGHFSPASLAATVEALVKRAETDCGVSLSSAYVALPSRDAVSRRGLGSVRLPKGAVGEEEFRACMESAQMDARAAGEEVVANRVVSVSVDGRRMESAVNAKGSQLDMEIVYVSCPSRLLATFTEAMRLAGLECKGYLLDILAAGEAVLLPEEMEEGVALVDVGTSRTTVGIWRQGAFDYFFTFASGTEDFAEELARTFRISMEDAQWMQQHWGCVAGALEGEVRRCGEREVRRSVASDTLAARVQEHLYSLQCALEERGLAPHVRSFVMAGTGTGMPGLEESAQAWAAGHGLRFRMGQPLGLDFGRARVSPHSSVVGVGLFLASLHPSSELLFYRNSKVSFASKVKRGVLKFWADFF